VNASNTEDITLRFLQQLFDPEGVSAEGYISLFFLKRPDTRVAKQFPASDLPAAVSLTRQFAENGYDCYFSPAVLRMPPTSGRGKKEDFLGARTLWVDLDSTPERLKERIVDDLHAFSPTPSAIVDSGHGIHAYWFLNQLVTNHQAIEHRNLWLANQLGGDHCHSIDHLLRVPNTINYK